MRRCFMPLFNFAFAHSHFSFTSPTVHLPPSPGAEGCDPLWLVITISTFSSHSYFAPPSGENNEGPSGTLREEDEEGAGHQRGTAAGMERPPATQRQKAQQR